MALPATENFTDSNGVKLTTHSASWTLNSGDFAIQSNGLVNDSGSGAECGAHWNADAFNDDQYAQVVVAASSASYMGPAVRCAASAGTYYGVYQNGSDGYFFKMVAGSWTQIGYLGSGLAVSDTLRLEASGTTITYKVNGTTESEQTDSSIASGSGGVTGWSDGNFTRLDDWEGGNLGGAAAVNGVSAVSVGVVTVGTRTFGALTVTALTAVASGGVTVGNAAPFQNVTGVSAVAAGVATNGTPLLQITLPGIAAEANGSVTIGAPSFGAVDVSTLTAVGAGVVTTGTAALSYAVTGATAEATGAVTVGTPALSITVTGVSAGASGVATDGIATLSITLPAVAAEASAVATVGSPAVGVVDASAITVEVNGVVTVGILDAVVPQAVDGIPAEAQGVVTTGTATLSLTVAGAAAEGAAGVSDGTPAFGALDVAGQTATGGGVVTVGTTSLAFTVLANTAEVTGEVTAGSIALYVTTSAQSVTAYGITVDGALELLPLTVTGQTAEANGVATILTVIPDTYIAIVWVGDRAQFAITSGHTAQFDALIGDVAWIDVQEDSLA